MPALKSRSLFISHSWSYGDAYEKLVGLLDAASNFEYKNYSVPKNDPGSQRAERRGALQRHQESDGVL